MAQKQRPGEFLRPLSPKKASARKVPSFTMMPAKSSDFQSRARLTQSVKGMHRTQRSHEHLRASRAPTTPGYAALDLFMVKKHVDEELAEMLEDLEKHYAERQVESQMMCELVQIVTRFSKAPVEELRNGFSADALLDVKRLMQQRKEQEGDQQDPVELEFLIRTLFLLSSCVRLEKMADEREETAVSRSNSVGDGGISSPEDSPRSPALTPSASPPSPDDVMTAKELLGSNSAPSESILSDEMKLPLPARERPQLKSPGGTSLLLDTIADITPSEPAPLTPRTAALPELQELVKCRICERDVAIGRLVRHSQLCLKHSKWELKSLELDEDLVKILGQELQVLQSRTDDDLQFLQGVLEIVVEARNASVHGDLDTLKELSDRVAKLRKKERGEGDSPKSRRMSAAPRLVKGEPIAEEPVASPEEEPRNRRLSLRAPFLRTDSRDILMGKKRPQLLQKPNPRIQLLSTLSKLLTRKKTVVRKLKESFDRLPGDLQADVVQLLSTPSIADFDILKPITRGGFACVYLARKKSTGDLMAIKVLKQDEMVDRSQVDNVIGEKNILATTSCPYVVRLYYAFKTQENVCMAMEFLSGGDLCAPLLEMQCGLDEDLVRFYIAETLQALEYLHSKGIIHRDLKPDNMLISGEGHLKLTDFGLSHFGLDKQAHEFWGDIKDSARSFKLSRNRQEVEVKEERIVGTPDYLAPEVLLGLSHGPAVDYWALGVIMFELLTGVPPFNGDAPSEIFENILNRRFCVEWSEMLEAGISAEAIDLIQQLLRDEPSERLGTMGTDVKAHPWFEPIEDWENLRKSEAPFKPELKSSDSTEFFEARQEFWPMIEEDFGLGSSTDDSSVSVELDDLVEDTPPEDMRSDLMQRIQKEQGPFGSFWCINALNLHERNVDLYEAQVHELSPNK